ncbi:MAG TPA: hypothetical protein VGL91_05445 [Acidobacteriota bacterium]
MRTKVALQLLVSSLLYTGTFWASNSTNFGPDGLKVFVDFRPVLQASREVLVEKPPLGMALELEDSGKSTGVLETATHEYASGTLSKDHLEKIAVRHDLSDGTWEKVRYKLQVKVEPIGPKETRVIADALVEGLKRSFTGKEEWIPVPSNGNLEETFLLHLGRKLFGEQFSLQAKKKTLWQRDPRYVPDPDSNNNKVAKPEIKRW